MLLSDLKHCAVLPSADLWSWCWWPHRCPNYLKEAHASCFQKLNISEIHLNPSDWFTFPLGVMHFVRLPGLDCSLPGLWSDCSKHWASTYPLKAVRNMSAVKNSAICFEIMCNIYIVTLLFFFLLAGVASAKKKACNLEGFCFVLFCFLRTSILFMTIQFYDCKKYLLLKYMTFLWEFADTWLLCVCVDNSTIYYRILKCLFEMKLPNIIFFFVQKYPVKR